MKKSQSIVSNMEKKKSFHFLITISWLLLLLIIWQGIVVGFHVSDWILPKPTSIAQQLYDMKDILWPNIWQTLQEVLLGLCLSILFGAAVATIMDVVPIFHVLIRPLLVISQTVPIVAIAPLLIVWFGFGLLPKMLVVILICFFPITLNILEGFQTVDPDLLKLFKTMHAKKWQLYQKVKFPAVLPYFFPGLKIAVTYSVMGAIIGEWLGASEGLGVMLTRATKSFLTSQLFAIAAIIVGLTFILYTIVELLQRLVAPWIYRKEEKK
ncbi:ABC transporter permease [Heyndrickxia ginsengihumi]|uniref:ABC transporter permease n=1 Tax=Heyndrickxia ginsengihumi TaxID=363870 RepID=A0A0A6VB82_9BACI|nr:ABC transporter permease [Heyndrickxia ginsengihumi]KHD85530.1 ABC transporter permease [Heyndrickxia ginsengihumi]